MADSTKYLTLTNLWEGSILRVSRPSLCKTAQQIEQVGDLHARKRRSKTAPSVLPESLINNAPINLERMRFFAWESVFFAAHIGTALLPPILGTTLVRNSRSKSGVSVTDGHLANGSCGCVVPRGEGGTGDSTSRPSSRPAKRNHLPLLLHPLSTPASRSSGS